MGARLSSCSSDAFSKKVVAEIPDELRKTLQPLLRLVAKLSDEIKLFDKKIEQLADERYPHTQLVRQVKGVGPTRQFGRSEPSLSGPALECSRMRVIREESRSPRRSTDRNSGLPRDRKRLRLADRIAVVGLLRSG